jgi:hypothetical protein
MRFTRNELIWCIARLLAMTGWLRSEHYWRSVDVKWSNVTERWSAISDRQDALIAYWRTKANESPNQEMR